ncbi:MAG: 6-O-methylguanine methyltransferase, binding domain, partial [Actinomycetota bacterium]
RNPMPIVVPFHRVVGAGSRLGGYAGAEDGASDRVKRALQSAEARAARLPCPPHRSPRA